MCKKILILVLSSDWPPYDSLMRCSQNTWDSINIEGVESVFYLSESTKKNTDKVIYLPVDNNLFSMGHKTIMALEWALKNKEFDYIARPQANVYINKKELVNYVNGLPDKNVFTTLEVMAEKEEDRYGWGCGTLFSKDVVQLLVDNKHLWDHKKMEDVSMSQLLRRLGVPYTQAKICTIDKVANKEGWQMTCYGGESYHIKTFSEVRKDGNYYYRCKQDANRKLDEYIMQELFRYLN